MDIFIARQPILNAHKRLFAYELLYRGTKRTTLNTVSGNKATTSVLSSAFLTEGIDKISGSRPCFINFTRQLLLQNLPASFPKTLLVIEVLEDVPPTSDIIDICKKLKSNGYTIALDDFIYDASLEPLIALADIIKFDLRLSSIDTIQRTIYRLSRYKLKYLAEKVETHEEFAQTVKLGFTYFQGFFFCRPEKIRIREVDSAKINLVNLLAEVNRKTTSVKKMEKIITEDVGLAYKLLRYINSSYFYRFNKIDSVNHAISYLGELEIRRFILLVLISELATDKPTELVRMAVVRARMCQLLAQETVFSSKDDEIFLLGLFSLLDAMLDTSMEFICERLSLSDPLKNALIHRTGPYSPFLRLVLSYEKRDKPGCLTALQELLLNPGILHQMYMESISFAESVLL
ncbi:MAG: HDOD domain-containing protein [Desulfocapsaceae bacterium]|nr:HDOD domain-containing protein [Desulfocapsaceae bacterium]